jgi:hypothetical protein
MWPWAFQPRGVLQAFANFGKEFNAFANGQALLVAIQSDGNAGDVLHDEVRLAGELIPAGVTGEPGAAMVASASCAADVLPALEEVGVLGLSSPVGPSASSMRTSGRERNGQVARVYHDKSGIEERCSAV